MEAFNISSNQIEYFFLVFVRITTIVSLLPVFSSYSIPVQLKVAFSILLTAILFTSIMAAHGPTITQPLSMTLMFLLVIKEVLVGLAIGFVASFLFQAVQFAGRLIDLEIGFSFVEVMDPFTDEMITAIGQFYMIIFTIIFLAFNGHYFLILAIQKSFEIVPIASAHFGNGGMSVQITRMVSDIFIIGIKIAAPVYVTLLISELAMGVIARTVPQINIFFVGMPLKIVVGMCIIIIVLPSLATIFKSVVFEGLIQDIWRILYLMA